MGPSGHDHAPERDERVRTRLTYLPEREDSAGQLGRAGGVRAGLEAAAPLLFGLLASASAFPGFCASGAVPGGGAAGLAGSGRIPECTSSCFSSFANSS